MSSDGGGAAPHRSATAQRTMLGRTILTSLMLGLAALLLWPLAGQAGASASIDQAPILHVVRDSDLPAAEDQYLPTGALSAHYFALDNNETLRDAQREERFLTRAGFRSSAISGFVAERSVTIKSTAIELGSAGQAARALSHEATLNAASQPPVGSRVSRHPDRRFAHAILLTFSPLRSGWSGGVEILASAGSYIYALQAYAKPDSVSRGSIEHLLGAVMARG